MSDAPFPSVTTHTSRITLGILGTNFEYNYEVAVLDGAMEAAHQHDVNLIAFCAARLRAQDTVLSDNTPLYELTLRHNIQALVLLSSTLTGSAGITEIQTFAARAHVPVVSLGVELPGV